MIHTFNDIKSHVGHEIDCVTYGDDENIAIECVTCGMVLIDLSPNQTVGVDDNDGKTIAHVWSVVDLMDRARERHINLSDQQCLEILARVDDGKDANIGINWDVLDSHTDDYLALMSG